MVVTFPSMPWLGSYSLVCGNRVHHGKARLVFH